MKLVMDEYYGNVYEGYLADLYESNCGVEGETCFKGKDSEAYKLVADLNMAIYSEDDEVQIIGAYFTTGDNNTIVLKYKEVGQYNETIIHKCN